LSPNKTINFNRLSSLCVSFSSSYDIVISFDICHEQHSQGVNIDDALNILKTHAEGPPTGGQQQAPPPPPAYASNLTQLQCHVVGFELIT